MRDAFSIWGMVLVSILAGRVNFSHFYDGRGNPTWLNMLMTVLVLMFWIVYLVVNRRSRGYLIWSLCLTMGLLVTLGLALVQNMVNLPDFLETLLLMSALLFLPPFHGIIGFSQPWLLRVCVVLLLVWLGAHIYFLHQLRGEKGACHET